MLNDSTVEALNRSEMVQILRGDGIYAHKGMSREELMELVKGNRDTLPPEDALTKMRERIMALLEEKGDRFKIIGCVRDCFQHADAHVVACHIQLFGEEEIDADQ